MARTSTKTSLAVNTSISRRPSRTAAFQAGRAPSAKRRTSILLLSSLLVSVACMASKSVSTRSHWGTF